VKSRCLLDTHIGQLHQPLTLWLAQNVVGCKSLRTIQLFFCHYDAVALVIQQPLKLTRISRPASQTTSVRSYGRLLPQQINQLSIMWIVSRLLLSCVSSTVSSSTRNALTEDLYAVVNASEFKQQHATLTSQCVSFIKIPQTVHQIWCSQDMTLTACCDLDL